MNARLTPREEHATLLALECSHPAPDARRCLRTARCRLETAIQSHDRDIIAHEVERAREVRMAWETFGKAAE